jgi:hypothetical protein
VSSRLFGCFAWTRERTYPDEELQKGQAFRTTDVFGGSGAMFRNSQWLIVRLAMFIIQIRGGLQGNVKPYFIKYYIDHDLTGILCHPENFMALYMGLTMLAGVAGSIRGEPPFLKAGVVQGHGDEDRAPRLARAQRAAPVRATAMVGSVALLLIMAGNFFT